MNAQGGIQLQLFQADFLASRSALQDIKKALMMTGIFGPKCSGLLERSNQHGYLEKMLQELTMATSTKYAVGWRTTTTALQEYLKYQLVYSAPITNGIEYLLLPTPNSVDGKNFMRSLTALNRYREAGHQKKLILELLRKGYTDLQIVNAYEKAMGFPIGWTDLKA